MVNKIALSMLLLFVSFVALTSCTNMQRAGYGKKETRSDSNLPPKKKYTTESRPTLWGIITTKFICIDSDTYSLTHQMSLKTNHWIALPIGTIYWSILSIILNLLVF